MTAFDRIEPRMAELLGELASAQVPDYVDDMLQQAAVSRQRPAWSSLERWIPMAVLARTQSMRPLPWRLIAIGAAILLLLGAVLTYIGSQPPPLPAPFGPARNGDIVFGTVDGEILAFDPAAGTSRTLISGDDTDSDPWFTNDGTRFAFDRDTQGSGRALYIASADGSGVHQLLEPDAVIEKFDWSPSGDRFYLSRGGGPRGLVTIVNASDGAPTSFELEMDVFGVLWRPNSDQLIVTGETTSELATRERGFYLVRPDGTGLEEIVASPTIINEPTVSPDGSKIAYATWDTGAEGRIHVFDIEAGVEIGPDFSPTFDYTDLTPVFSPDGSKLMVERYDVDGYRPTILSIDGRAAPVALGAHHPEMTNGARAIFSPDGTKVLATYQDDGTTWMLDTSTGAAEEMRWPIPRGSSATWQRLAP
jgi:Tol biopolymer transport system component